MKQIDISQWKEFELSELFELVPTKKLDYKKQDLPDLADEIFNLPALTCTAYNNGISCYVPRNEATILKNMLSIAANGDAPAFYQAQEFTILQDAYALRFKNEELNSYQYLFLLVSLQKILLKFGWTNKSGWQKVKQEKILLPINTEGTIDFDFMENFIKNIQNELKPLLDTYFMMNGGGLYLFLHISLTHKKIIFLKRLLCK